MKTKDNDNEDILLLFQWTGVPDHHIVDGYKEQLRGSFIEIVQRRVLVLNRRNRILYDRTL